MTTPTSRPSSHGHGLSSLEEEEMVDQLKALRPTMPSRETIHSWAHLMARVSREATEEQLHHLKPSEPTPFSSMKWALAMEEAAGNGMPPLKEPRESHKHPGGNFMKPAYRKRFLYAAAATIALTAGVLALLITPSEKNSMVSMGDLNRQAVKIVSEGVNWNKEKGIAERQYRVELEDTVELRDRNGKRITVSVPSTQTVVVPVETY